MTDYTLSKGSHLTPDAGRCAMEWVAYLAGEPHSDQPVCVSPLLKGFCIKLNDALPDNTRQKMRPLLARTIGTAGDGMDEHRSWLATDWLVREYVPAFMELTPALKHHAEVLRALPPVLAAEALDRAMIGLSVARTDAAAARDAAWAAAGDAAWDAAWAAAGAAAGDAAGAAAGDAAWTVARDAAWAAAWDAAGDAAWAAAWDAAGDAAGGAARAAARAAAGGAARAAARAAAGGAARAAAGGAARAAARDALAPTVERLQLSALGLLDRMLPGEIVRVPVAADWRELVQA